MNNLIAKVLVGGTLAAMATAAPTWADEYLGFGGPAVKIDVYNGALAVPLSVPDIRFSGPLVQFDPYNAIVLAAVLSLAAKVSAEELYSGYAFSHLEFAGAPVETDPYNATLAATVLSSVRALPADSLYGSYAFAPGNGISRLWEGPIPFNK